MIITADAIDGLKTIDSGTADCCVTSPPYFGLRDYGVEGQIGLEATPEEYAQKLVNVFREVYRVLKNDGTLWVVIGDSYAGSGKGGQSDFIRSGNWQPVYGNRGKTYGHKPKDLLGIPWLLAFALRADGWYLRQSIIWHKPNAMPESVTDRCTKSHEYVFLLSKSPKYYYDSAAIREPSSKHSLSRAKHSGGARYGGNKYTAFPELFYRTKSGGVYEYKPLRNKRDVWTVSTKPSKEAHFATFPPELIRPCILAGSRPAGIVLDPFFGAGTTGLVAAEHGRAFTGIEINPDYVKIARERLSNIQQRIL